MRHIRFPRLFAHVVSTVAVGKHAVL